MWGAVGSLISTLLQIYCALMLLVGWWGAGMVICLERGADLHMAQLMPLPLTVSCFSKIEIGFTVLVPAYPGSPGQRAIKQVCVCVLLENLMVKKNYENQLRINRVTTMSLMSPFLEHGVYLVNVVVMYCFVVWVIKPWKSTASTSLICSSLALQTASHRCYLRLV